jgi:hypothetical protein
MPCPDSKLFFESGGEARLREGGHLSYRDFYLEFLQLTWTYNMEENLRKREFLEREAT